ncbi:hypothetical protein W04_3568 [Pseudoalteromonas sp. SW0106-04]|uniref:hypothetical protein n=1 Tax=Pseudoalteromonas sp. SW0106-04 TaxID=1702169 RepID=UPI0006B65B70|nr:hypothetical protein [Pseudoalteromonas sp. SW0106-04]GAP76989.1 hypothetical protein W04_3568 [Pseudoalteromonas sp. SW0106-04]
MSQDIADLKAKVAELALALGQDIEPESTKTKLSKQIKELEEALSKQGTDDGEGTGDGTGDGTGTGDGAAKPVAVYNKRNAVVITTVNGSDVELKPGKNTVPADLAKKLAEIKGISLYESA